MARTRAPYAAVFRDQMAVLVRSGRTPEELAREFEPSAQAIRNLVAQAGGDAGKRIDGLGACRELAPSKQESTTYEPFPVCKLLILGCRLLIPDRLLV